MSYILRSSNGLIDLEKPKVMGIINLTPDSFYDQSRVLEINKVVELVGQMIEEGVDIIDMGAVTSKPGSQVPSISEELDRLTSPLMAVRASFPEIPISIDTYRSEVLKACLDLRIDMVNDISGGRYDPEFLDIVAKSGLPYVLMHMQGNPHTMQKNPAYEDVVLDIMKYFDQGLDRCRKAGIIDIIIDPGLGFGKSLQDNYVLLAHLGSFKIFDHPVLIGISRKSMIYRTLNTSPESSLNGTTALHILALQNGANILRVHDVSEAKECIALWQQYDNAANCT